MKINGPTKTRFTTLLVILIALSIGGCARKEKETDTRAKPDLKFEKSKWKAKDEKSYIYRRQMVNDLLYGYQWAGVSKDSLLQMLGEPDNVEVGRIYLYYYQYEPKLGGLMSSHKAITFEIKPDSNIVKTVKLGEGLNWD